MLFVIHGAFFRKMMYDAPIPPTCSTCCYYCIPILTFPFISPLVFSLLCFMPHECRPLALMDVLWNPSCSCFLLKSWKLFSTFASLCYHIDSLLHRLFIFLTNFVQLISMYDILFLTMCSLCLPYIVQISNFGHCISIFCGPQGSMLVDAGIQLPKLQRNTSTPARKALPALLHITIHLMTCKN